MEVLSMITTNSRLQQSWQSWGAVTYTDNSLGFPTDFVPEDRVHALNPGRIWAPAPAAFIHSPVGQMVLFVAVVVLTSCNIASRWGAMVLSNDNGQARADHDSHWAERVSQYVKEHASHVQLMSDRCNKQVYRMVNRSFSQLAAPGYPSQCYSRLACFHVAKKRD